MPAPRDPRHAVANANSEFYRAFESLDIERMGQIWLPESYVSCTHPGWSRILGWGAVMQSWERIFAGAFGVRIQVSEEVTQVRGDIAWVTCTEDVETQLADGVSRGLVEATNVFERHDGRWFLIHHHGSPLIRDPDDEPRLH